MSYDNLEKSSFEGSPIELYHFSMGPDSFYQTSGSEEVTYLGNVYIPNPLERDDIALTGEINKSPMTIKLARDNEVAELFKLGFPSSGVSLTLHRKHSNDSEVILLWRGRVNSCGFTENSAKLVCESVFTSIKRSGLFRNYQKTCPHMLYDSECKVPRTPETGVVDSASGIEVVSSTFALKPDGYYTGGMFETGADLRYVFTHVGDTITVDRVINNLSSGSSMLVYAGCDRSKSTCKDKFDNLNNFGGYPFIPTNNPFGSTGIK